MRKDIKPDDQLITRGMLRRALQPLKLADAKLREELHAIEFRLDTKIDSRFLELNNKMDERFNRIDDVLKKHLDTIQGLIEQVVLPESN